MQHINSYINENFPLEYKAILKYLVNTALSNSIELYFIGGIVRDILFGRKNLDLDIVVVSQAFDAISFAKSLQESYSKNIIDNKKDKSIVVDNVSIELINILSFKKYYTSKLIFKVKTSGNKKAKEIKIDLATPRKEVYPHQVSNPTVTKSTLKDDLYRRDFSINAIAYNINQLFSKNISNNNIIVDEYNGLECINKYELKTLHQDSFSEDPSRIIRGLRFVNRYSKVNLKVNFDTVNQIEKYKHLLGDVTFSRIALELRRMLNEKYAAKSFMKYIKLYNLEKEFYEYFGIDNSFFIELGELNKLHKRKPDKLFARKELIVKSVSLSHNFGKKRSLLELESFIKLLGGTSDEQRKLINLAEINIKK